MQNKYSCPSCGKELSEADAIREFCFHCHKVFDSPIMKNIPKRQETKQELLREKTQEIVHSIPRWTFIIPTCLLFVILILLVVWHIPSQKQRNLLKPVSIVAPEDIETRIEFKPAGLHSVGGGYGIQGVELFKGFAYEGKITNTGFQLAPVVEVNLSWECDEKGVSIKYKASGKEKFKNLLLVRRGNFLD